MENKTVALKKLSMKNREQKWGFFFIMPWLIGFLVFYAVPIISSLIFSFLNYNLIEPDKTTFVGLGNWKRALFQDPQIIESIGHIMQYTIIALPLSLGFSIIAAILLNNKHLLGAKLFRTLYYIPTMVPLVATVLIWRGVLNEQTGWITLILQNLGFEGQRWLASTKLIYFSYAFIGLWGCGNTIVIFLAGLQGVPESLYEASLIDGANGWQRFTKITVPLMTPVIFYNLLTGIINMMQYFLVPMVINQGSGFPDGKTNFPMVLFYRHSFSYFNMGYGAVIAWIIFLIGLIFTLVLFGTSNKWVYYAGEKK